MKLTVSLLKNGWIEDDRFLLVFGMLLIPFSPFFRFSPLPIVTSEKSMKKMKVAMIWTVQWVCFHQNPSKRYHEIELFLQWLTSLNCFTGWCEQPSFCCYPLLRPFNSEKVHPECSWLLLTISSSPGLDRQKCWWFRNPVITHHLGCMKRIFNRLFRFQTHATMAQMSPDFRWINSPTRYFPWRVTRHSQLRKALG